VLQRAFNLMGVEYADAEPIIEAIDDWRDPNVRRGLDAAESDYYLRLKPPYVAKDGPIDDLTELLLVRGITPEMYWGPGRSIDLAPAPTRGRRLGIPANNGSPQAAVGLADLFTTLSGRLININTASAAVLQLLPGIDANIAQGIINARAGPDGVEGDDDDVPFRNPGELVNVPGLTPPQVGALRMMCNVRSETFEVHVTAAIGGVKRHYVGMLRRLNARAVQTLFFYRE
jgi:general secretion pathway protein K